VRGVMEGTLTMEGYPCWSLRRAATSRPTYRGQHRRVPGRYFGRPGENPSFVVDDGANFNGKIELISQ